MALQDRSGSGHVGELAVRARADDDLVDGDVAALARAVRVFGQVRPGDRAVDLAEVDVDDALIFCVGIGLERCPGAVHAALNIGARHVVDGEDAVLAARLDGHVADRQAVIDREVLATPSPANSMDW